MRKLALWACVLASVLGSLGSVAHATLIEALDMEGLVQRSDAIAVVRVIDQQARWGDDGRILTDVLLEVEDRVSGDVPVGERFILVRMGGAIGDLGMRIEGEPAFENDARYLVFARRWEGWYRPVGMSQGVMRIDGNRVLPGGAGLSLVRPNGTPALGPMWRPRALDAVLEDVRSLVGR